MKGRWAWLVAILLVLFACAPPKNTVHLPPLENPTPSPSPTPTTPMAASYPAFHVGEVGVAYAALTPTATGGVQPYKWSLGAGALPPGLNLSNDGSVSGSPTAAGTYAFTIQAADSGDSTVPISGQINVAGHVQATLLPACAQYCNVELGCVTACGVFGTLGGGVAPYSYALISGQLPAGTSLNGLALAGTFVGLTGYLKFTVQVTDALGATATISPTFWMYPHISLTGGTIPAPNATGPCWWTGYDPNTPGCRAQFAYSGGTPNAGTVTASASWASYTCNYPPACAAPPPMPTIVVGSGMITVSVPRGYALGTSGYKGTLTITLTNQDPCSPGPAACSTSASVTITQLSG